jgi:hypothetical protein
LTPNTAVPGAGWAGAPPGSSTAEVVAVVLAVVLVGVVVGLDALTVLDEDEDDVR